jgi:hypothetical protein
MYKVKSQPLGCSSCEPKPACYSWSTLLATPQGIGPRCSPLARGGILTDVLPAIGGRHRRQQRRPLTPDHIRLVLFHFLCC